MDKIIPKSDEVLNRQQSLSMELPCRCLDKPDHGIKDEKMQEIAKDLIYPIIFIVKSFYRSIVDLGASNKLEMSLSFSSQ